MTVTKANLLWVDLEMTGLDPVQDRIIEVAAIATDFDFHRLASFQMPVQVDPALVKRRMVGDFWQAHGATRQALISQSSSDQARPTRQVEQALVAFVQANFDLDSPIYLAGNSVHQDRRFIEHEWPQLNQLLNYRMLDVSAWKIIFEQRGVKFTKPEMHRAMSDIEGSIDELKYYLKRVKF